MNYASAVIKWAAEKLSDLTILNSMVFLRGLTRRNAEVHLSRSNISSIPSQSARVDSLCQMPVNEKSREGGRE